MLLNPQGEEIAESFARLCAMREDDVQLLLAVKDTRGQIQTNRRYVRHISRELAGKERWRCDEEQSLLRQLHSWESRFSTDTMRREEERSRRSEHSGDNHDDDRASECDYSSSRACASSCIDEDATLHQIYLACVSEAYALCKPDLKSNPFSRISCTRRLFVSPTSSSTRSLGQYGICADSPRTGVAADHHTDDTTNDTAAMVWPVDMSTPHLLYFAKERFIPVTSSALSACPPASATEHEDCDTVEQHVRRDAKDEEASSCTRAGSCNNLHDWRRGWCILFFLWMRAMEEWWAAQMMRAGGTHVSHGAGRTREDGVHVCSQAAAQLIGDQRRRYDAQMQHMRALLRATRT